MTIPARHAEKKRNTLCLRGRRLGFSAKQERILHQNGPDEGAGSHSEVQRACQSLRHILVRVENAHENAQANRNTKLLGKYRFMRLWPSWGTVTTLKESPENVKRFVAHHLAIGAQQIVLFFDDPEDPAAELVTHLDRVTVVLCDDEHWIDRRPAAHQKRQKINANIAYQSTKLDWIIHLDADELIHARMDVARALAVVPPSQQVVRLPVAESFAGTQRGRNIFRYALPNSKKGREVGDRVYGEAYSILDGGLLSHRAGKHFVRTGQPDMALSIHGPFQHGTRDEGELAKDMTLLHLHSYDEDEWVGSVQRRLKRGAYQKKNNDDKRGAGKTADGLGRNAYLNRIIETEGEAGLRAFHRRVCRFDKDKRPLRRMGALLRVDLWEAEKNATFFPGSAPVAARSFRFDAAKGHFLAEVDFRGTRMVVFPDDNYTDHELARGIEVEKEELNSIQALVSGKSVVLYDIGANSGIYSLMVARSASDESRIHAFEPNPEMMARLQHNIELNGFDQIRTHGVALAGEDGTAQLYLHSNLGQASLLGSSAAGDDSKNISSGNSISVSLKPLKAFVEERKPGVLYVLKIDIEGAEPLCLIPFFQSAPRITWPDFILYEHAHTDKWQTVPEQVFPEGAYEVYQKFASNTLLRRSDFVGS